MNGYGVGKVGRKENSSSSFFSRRVWSAHEQGGGLRGRPALAGAFFSAEDDDEEEVGESALVVDPSFLSAVARSLFFRSANFASIAAIFAFVPPLTR